MTSINTFVTSALDHAHGFAKAVEGIRAALKGQLSPDVVREKLLAPVATYYAVPLIAKTRGEGVTWDTNHAKFETAKKAHQRLTKAVLGEVQNQKEELTVPAHIAKLAAALVEAAGEYEQAAKLIATAIAQAKAK